MLLVIMIGFVTCSITLTNIASVKAAVYQSNTVTGFYGEYRGDEQSLIADESALNETVTTEQQQATHHTAKLITLPVTGEQESVFLILAGFLLVGGSLYRLREET